VCTAGAGAAQAEVTTLDMTYPPPTQNVQLFKELFYVLQLFNYVLKLNILVVLGHLPQCQVMLSERPV